MVGTLLCLLFLRDSGSLMLPSLVVAQEGLAWLLAPGFAWLLSGLWCWLR